MISWSTSSSASESASVFHDPTGSRKRAPAREATPEQFGALMQDGIARYGAIIKATGIQAE
jgi:hypothetical protein